MKKLFTFISIVAVAVAFSSCNDKSILDYSAQEIAEASLVKRNDWVEFGLKGSVKEYTESYYGNAEMDDAGSLIKKDITSKEVYTFNTAGFITSEKRYESSGLLLEAQFTYNDQNQLMEIKDKDYSYSTDGNPTESWYVYTYTATEATEIKRSSTDNGVNWHLVAETVYLLDEYGRIDYENQKTYHYANEQRPPLQYEFVSKKTKDGVGNITSVLEYDVSYNPTEYYLYFYMEYNCSYY